MSYANNALGSSGGSVTSLISSIVLAALVLGGNHVAQVVLNEQSGRLIYDYSAKAWAPVADKNDSARASEVNAYNTLAECVQTWPKIGNLAERDQAWFVIETCEQRALDGSDNTLAVNQAIARRQEAWPAREAKSLPWSEWSRPTPIPRPMIDAPAPAVNPDARTAP